MTRQEAISVLENDAEYMYSQDSPYCREAYQMAVRALEVEPIKHGRWIFEQIPLPLSDSSKVCVRCSVCNTHWDKECSGYSYCPNCGAKMDEEEKL